MNRILLKTFFLLLAVMLSASGVAQKRNKQLTIEVTSVEGDNLKGQPLTLMQTDYEVSYGSLVLDADGRCQLKVYTGPHHLTIERSGFMTLEKDFVVGEDDSELTVSVTLQEKTRQPYALTATVDHDVATGRNDVQLTWNREAPSFFDDFEGYEPWAVSFGEWTGIDADGEAAAPLLGSYPNRGVMQYAQIINPLTVQPTWWYDYPILRPYEGQQYVGFTRTSSGNANDDWLISPVITVGTENLLQFYGKAADQFPERFMVYVTTTTDSPTQEDFVRIDQDNYETADYRGWKLYSYDLAGYVGKQVRFAIRYISHYNYYGSFMLMVDNVYVGQVETAVVNPNEQFRIYLDGELVGTTYDTNYTISNVSGGHHTVGVQAVYLEAVSAVTTTDIDVAATGFSRLAFEVSADSKLSADGQQISVLSTATAETFVLTVANGKAEVASLPNGRYMVDVAEGAFEAWQQTVDLTEDLTVTIELVDRMLAPYNMTGRLDDDNNLSLWWNQELGFTDSFEDYDDFASGVFGGWSTYDMDRQPVYPIALGSQTNIVSFPGSGTATNPTAIAPMVFNPWSTTPAMMPTDPAIAAPTGDKTIIFFSPQRQKADKWLISPLLDIHEGYQLTVKAKGYTSMYPESMEFCVSDGGDHPDDFVPLSKVDELSSDAWTIYATDLADYAGSSVRLAVHYTSYDAFLAQIDDFTVGPEEGSSNYIDYGNVVRYDVYLDGRKIGETQEPHFVIENLSEGHHVVKVVTVYKNGSSEATIYEVGTATAIGHLAAQATATGRDEVVDLAGRRVSGSRTHGMYIVRKNGQVYKIMK